MKGKEAKFWEALRKINIYYKQAGIILSDTDSFTKYPDMLALLQQYEKSQATLWKSQRKAYDDIAKENIAYYICSDEKKLLETIKELIIIQSLSRNSQQMSPEEEELLRLVSSGLTELVYIIEYTENEEHNFLKSEARYRKLSVFLERAEKLRFEGLCRLFRENNTTDSLSSIIFAKDFLENAKKCMAIMFNIVENIRLLTADK